MCGHQEVREVFGLSKNEGSEQIRILPNKKPPC